MDTSRFRQFDFSAGVQRKTSWLLRRQNEVELSINGKFDDEIGAIETRPGYEQFGSTIVASKAIRGMHVANYDGGSKLLVAINETGTSTETELYHVQSGSNTEVTITSNPNDDTEWQMVTVLNETYAAGYSDTDSAYMTPLNIQEDLTTSTSRNLTDAPDGARFVMDFDGLLWLLNCKISTTEYPDRIYKGFPKAEITFTKGAQDSTTEVLVDSTSFLKPSMVVDIYKAGTDTKLKDSVTVQTVDKAANKFTFTASTEDVATTDINTSTDVITVATNTWMTDGQPVTLSTSGTAPDPLVAGTTYFVIRLTSTTIKLATTYDNAIADTAINITTQGTGTHTLTEAIYVADNDEIWLEDRKDEISFMFNSTDPTPETSDYITIPPGRVSSRSITGWGKVNNRAFIFTRSSTIKLASRASNPIVLYQDVGCISHRSIVSMGDLLIWLDADGNVRANNDNTGQFEIISDGVARGYLKQATQAQLAQASAVGIDNRYKLWIGAIDGKNIRLVYDIRANTWSIEEHNRDMRVQVVWDQSGNNLPYFGDETGKIMKDETGNTDATAAINWYTRLGNNLFGTEQEKNYHGMYVFSRNMKGADIQVVVNDGDPIDVGEIRENAQYISFPQKGRKYEGNYYDVIISNSGATSNSKLLGLVHYFSIEESHAGRKR